MVLNFRLINMYFTVAFIGLIISYMVIVATSQSTPLIYYDVPSHGLDETGISIQLSFECPATCSFVFQDNSKTMRPELSMLNSYSFYGTLGDPALLPGSYSYYFTLVPDNSSVVVSTYDNTSKPKLVYILLIMFLGFPFGILFLVMIFSCVIDCSKYFSKPMTEQPGDRAGQYGSRD